MNKKHSLHFVNRIDHFELQIQFFFLIGPALLSFIPNGYSYKEFLQNQINKLLEDVQPDREWYLSTTEHFSKVSHNWLNKNTRKMDHWIHFPDLLDLQTSNRIITFYGAIPNPLFIKH